MYYCNQDQYEFYGDRVEQICDFLTSGWGCIRKKDLMSLFRITNMEYAHMIRFIRGKNYKVIEEDDYLYIEYYPGCPVQKKYMNALSVLTSIYNKNKDKTVTITDVVHTNIFLAKMFIQNSKTNQLRTYYVLDMAYITMPIYAMRDAILAEESNGLDDTDKVIMIIYEDSEIDYLDTKLPLFYALMIEGENEDYFEFYDNKQLKNDSE